MNKYLPPKTIITDFGSSKEKSHNVIKENLKRGISWTSSHPIAGSEVSGPVHGKKDLFSNLPEFVSAGEAIDEFDENKYFE